MFQLFLFFLEQMFGTKSIALLQGIRVSYDTNKHNGHNLISRFSSHHRHSPIMPCLYVSGLIQIVYGPPRDVINTTHYLVGFNGNQNEGTVRWLEEGSQIRMSLQMCADGWIILFDQDLFRITKRGNHIAFLQDWPVCISNIKENSHLSV